MLESKQDDNQKSHTQWWKFSIRIITNIFRIYSSNFIKNLTLFLFVTAASRYQYIDFLNILKQFITHIYIMTLLQVFDVFLYTNVFCHPYENVSVTRT
jgi:hypothetical protein